jgi:tRNA A37 threonylcarbamoyladenosine modification protein TsaB
MLDARKDEIYAALYRLQGDKMIKLIPETACRPKAFIETISEDCVFFGSGALKHKALIDELLQGKVNAFFPPPSKMHPSAAQVGEIALALADETSVDPISLIPFYLKQSDSERNG